MGVLDDLARARADYERGEWTTAYDRWAEVEPSAMTADDLERVAMAATLLGRREAASEAHQRAFRLHEAAGETSRALRCSFWLAMMHGTSGDPGSAAGWSARAERLLTEEPTDPAGPGFVAFLRMFRAISTGDWAAAAREATTAAEVGRATADPDLLPLGLCGQGRTVLYGGGTFEGLACLDEAMASLTPGVTGKQASPIVVGHVYCVAIEGCQEIGDLGRVVEWTALLDRWCEAQPGLVTFTGQCSVHRGQVMRARGAWGPALEEFATAIDRYTAAGLPDAVGLAETERGDVLRLRGDLDGADAAYQRAGERGHDPQPGLALLWLARGSSDAAVASVRRLLVEAVSPVHRARILPAAAEVLLAAGLLEEAGEVVADLHRAATEIGSVSLVAAAAQAGGALSLARDDPGGALPYLRKARQLWARAEVPHDAARVSRLTGEALAALGDEESARRELAAARAAFVSLDARPDVAAVDRLLTPRRPPGGLTAREVEVLRLVAGGLSNARVAAELVLSEKTVARHLSNIFTKLGVGSRTAAAAYAFEHDLV